MEGLSYYFWLNVTVAICVLLSIACVYCKSLSVLKLRGFPLKLGYPRPFEDLFWFGRLKARQKVPYALNRLIHISFQFNLFSPLGL